MVREVKEKSDVVPLLGEVFREHGYSGTSLSEITRRTGLGKSSLYHFFPGGKQEMAEVVLDDVAAWFEVNVFKPLRADDKPEVSIDRMFKQVNSYFNSGKRICLVGVFALDDTRELFATRINAYFSCWTKALIAALKHLGLSTKDARDSAEDVVAGIQGALVLARSQDNPGIFTHSLKRLQYRLLAIVPRD